MDENNNKIESDIFSAEIEKKAMPTSVDLPNIQSILEEFYRIHNPERINTIHLIIDKYKGNEIELLKSLKEKYNINNYKPFDAILNEPVIGTFAINVEIINSDNISNSNKSESNSSNEKINASKEGFLQSTLNNLTSSALSSGSSSKTTLSSLTDLSSKEILFCHNIC